MKKLLGMCFAVVATSASAQVFPSGFFPTAANLIENYDTTAPGSYISFPMFLGLGAAARLMPVNALLVNNFGTWITPPHIMFGRGTDVQIKVGQPMTYFGGWFREAPAGILVTQATFRFYDQFNLPIGSQTAAITPFWQWIGWKTIPQWSRVEIIGNGSLPGYVAFDETRIRP